MTGYVKISYTNGKRRVRADRYTVKHIIEACLLRSYAGALKDFLNAAESAIDYINDLDVRL